MEVIFCSVLKQGSGTEGEQCKPTSRTSSTKEIIEVREMNRA